MAVVTNRSERFGHERDLRGEMIAHRNRLLGDWAAGRLGLSGAAADDYARSVMEARPGRPGAVAKVDRDLRVKGVIAAQFELPSALTRFTAEARRHVLAREGAGAMTPTMMTPTMMTPTMLRHRARAAQAEAIADGIIAVARGLRALTGRARDWFRAASARRELARLSERELADIGLTRSDVYRAGTAASATNRNEAERAAAA